MHYRVVERHTVVIGGSRTAATSKMEHFLITVNSFQPLTIITKCSTLDVAAALDPPLVVSCRRNIVSRFMQEIKTKFPLA